MNRYDKRVRERDEEDLLLAEADLGPLDVVEVEKPKFVWPTERMPIEKVPKRNLKAEAKASWELSKTRTTNGVRTSPDTVLDHLKAARQGIEVVAKALWDWVWDPSGRLVMAGHKRSIKTDPDQSKKDAAKRYRKKKKLVWETTNKRLGIVAAVTATFLTIAWGMIFMGDWKTRLGFALSTVAGVYILSKVGQFHRPLAASPSIPKARVLKPTAELYAEAFADAGINDIRVIGGVRAVDAGGWEVKVKLPRGKTFDDAAVAKNHRIIAGGLDINKECLFLNPVRGEGSERDLVLYQAPRDPMRGDCPDNPLADPKVKQWDFWNDGVPLGLDARGNPVKVPLIYNSMIIGAQPGAGKTFALFQVGSAAALDPDVDLAIISFKTSNDFAPLKPFCRVYECDGSGDTAAKTLRFLETVQAEINERNTRLGRYPIEDVPDSKVTEAIARDPSARMRPLVIIIDEFQTAVGTTRDKLGERIMAATEELARTIRSQGVSLVLAVQRAAKQDNFGNLRAYVPIRYALSVENDDDSNMVLESGHKSGVPGRDASLIPREGPYAGVGIIKGGDSGLAGPPTFMVKTYATSRVFLQDVAARAGATRGASQPSNVVELRKTGAGSDFVGEVRTAIEERDAEAIAVSVLAELLDLTVPKLLAQLDAAGIAPKVVRHDRWKDQGIGRGVKYIHIEQLPEAA